MASELDDIAAASPEVIAGMVHLRRRACERSGYSESEAMFFRHIDALKAEVARLKDVESAAKGLLKIPRANWGPAHEALASAMGLTHG
jgi:hypothetical protein